VHLVEMNCIVGRGDVEQEFSDGGKRDGCVREFPQAVWFGFDFGAERAAEDLVTEAYTCEANVGAIDPDICPLLAQSVEYAILRTTRAAN